MKLKTDKIVRNLWLPVILWLIFIPAGGQEYSSMFISDSLKENAHAVIREYIREFELQSEDKGIERIREAVTVLDKNGDNAAILVIGYDKDSRVSIYEANIYDKFGKKVKKIKQSEISDSPAKAGATLFSDNRVMSFRPDFGDYPYTVEYEYEVSFSNLISYGSWFPLREYDVSLEHARFTLFYPPGIQYLKKEINVSESPKIINQHDKTGVEWECSNIRAIEYEPFNTDLDERVPQVYLMPLRLSYGSYRGTASNWTEYGRWIQQLYEGRDNISQEEKIRVAGLLESANDTLAKIRLLYEYMQEHTRYVGIQLGIGGLQPFPAATVYETGYGDCKALSNYMHSLLKQIGVESYPALVSSGEYIKPVFKDFPNFLQFDHVILCVPFDKDTIWLECTSQNIPFGFLGTFTDDRDVLLITPEGGKLAHTRKYTTEENLRSCKAEFRIDAKGAANCTISTQYLALQYFDIFGLFSYNPDEQKKWIYSNLTLPSPQLSEYKLKNCKSSLPAATIDITLTSGNYCSFTGKYMVLPLNMINVQPAVKKVIKDRCSDFLISRSSVDYDTLIYHLPDGYKLESLPAGKNIKSAFGEYATTVDNAGNTIVYTRRYKVNEGRYKAAEYRNFCDFCLSVSKADGEKLMFSR